MGEAVMRLQWSMFAMWQATDWPQILVLYDLLLSMAPSPVIRLNRPLNLLQ
jgi:predicted RNA polymerase sigma factor